jgi:hypothetical protein
MLREWSGVGLRPSGWSVVGGRWVGGFVWVRNKVWRLIDSIASGTGTRD